MNISLNYKLIVLLFFILSLIYWPVIFSNAKFVTDEIKLITYLLILLLLSLKFNKINTYVFILLFLYFICFLIELYRFDFYLNSISFYGILFLFLLLFNNLSQSNEFQEYLISFWLIISYIIIVFSLIHFCLFAFLSINFDIFNWSESIININRITTDNISLFGKTTSVMFGEYRVHRLASYFNEPADFGIFCIINLMIINSLTFNKKDYLKNNNLRLLKILTILAGSLSLSFTFFILLVIILIRQFSKESILKLFIIFLFSVPFIILYFYSLIDLFNISSMSDRLNRMNCGIEYLVNSNTTQLFFGYGIHNNCNIYLEHLDKFQSYGFSSGYFKILTHRGLLPLLLVIASLYLVFKSKLGDFLIFLIIFLVITWHSQYLYLFLMLVLYSSYLKTNYSQQIK